MAEPTREEFDAAAAKVAQSAPDGLSRDDFYALIDQELANPHNGTSSGLALATARPAATLAAEVATNPNVPRAMASGGRMIGAIAPPVVGAVEGGPVGALAGLAGSAKGSWLGGKTGWFSGKLLQNVAAPVANVLEKVAPVASRMSGAAGVGDLAQMADPKRKDIGFLGIGGGTSDPNDPALVNAVIAKLRQKFGL